MIVSVTTTRIPSASTWQPGWLHLVQDENIDEVPIQFRHTESDTRIPRLFIIRAAGPFSARPPTMGEMAAEVAADFVAASRIPARPGSGRR